MESEPASVWQKTPAKASTLDLFQCKCGRKQLSTRDDMSRQIFRAYGVTEITASQGNSIAF